MASGTTTSTAQIRRPGRSVRSTHQAAAVPMTAHSAVTTTVSRIVFHSRVAVSGRKISLASAPQPAAARLDQQEDQRQGEDGGDDRAWRDRAAGRTGPGAAARGPRGRARQVPGRVAQPARRRSSTAARVPPGHSSPAWRSSAMAAEPSPRSAIVIGLGCRSPAASRGAAVVTPDAIGYS